MAAASVSSNSNIPGDGSSWGLDETAWSDHVFGILLNDDNLVFQSYINPSSFDLKK